MTQPISSAGTTEREASQGDSQLLLGLDVFGVGDEQRDARVRKGSSLDELFYATTTYRMGSEYRALLNFCGRFRQYAPYNAFLLYMQRPGVQFVATAGQWARRFGRDVKDGSRALVILAPMSPVLFLYDLEDTEGDPVPDDALRPFTTDGRVPHDVWGCTVQNSARDAVDIQVRDFGSALAGRVYRHPRHRLITHAPQSATAAKFAIDLNQRHDVTRRYATLVHELAHIHCGHLGADSDGWWPDASLLDKQCREFEAESVAYLVCSRLGITTHSERYLALYLRANREIPPISLERVLKASTYIESLGHGELGPRPLRKRPARRSP